MKDERSGVPGDAVEDRQRGGKDEGRYQGQRAGDRPGREQEAVDEQDGSVAADPAALLATVAGVLAVLGALLTLIAEFVA